MPAGMGDDCLTPLFDNVCVTHIEPVLCSPFQETKTFLPVRENVKSLPMF